MLESPMSAPRIWIGLPDREARKRQGTCECSGGGACSGSAEGGWDDVPIRECLEHVRAGTIRELYLSPESFVDQDGAQTVVKGSRRPGMVVLDTETGRLIERLPCTVDELRVWCQAWPEEVFQRVIALFLALDLLRSPQGSEPVGPSDESPTLAAWLHLTDRCNLACAYCYVNQSDALMDISVAQRAVDAVFRSATAHGYRQVKLKYAGGEPTLHFEALRAAQRRAEVLQAETGIQIESVMLTNGVQVTDAQTDFLLAHGVQVMLSLDGVGHDHDVQRPLVGNSGSSFVRVEGTLGRLLARGLKPFVLITITQRNIAGLPTLIDYLLDRDLHFAFNFYRPPGETVSGDLAFGQEEMIVGLRRAFDAIEARPPPFNLLPLLADRANLLIPHTRACDAGRNYLVIDYEGRIFKCQMDMASAVTTVCADDPLERVRSDACGIQNLRAEDKGCNACRWRFHCAGGCPRLTFQHTQRYDERSPLCGLYQAILPEVVRLEARRLLVHEEPWDYSFPLN